jgi:branched-chain amino acid transport system permease protein
VQRTPGNAAQSPLPPRVSRCALNPGYAPDSNQTVVLAIVIEQIINGLLVGSYYIVLALGLSMIFSLGGVVNLAHGAFYAVGAYFAYEIQKFAGFGGAVVLSPICVALLGVAIERAFLQRLYREDPMLGLLFTFGLALTIEQSLRLIWGTTGLPFSIPEGLRGTLLAGDFIYSYYRLTVLGVSAAAVLGCWLLLNKTAFGMIVRAGTRDPEMVRALGISLRPALAAVFALGVGLAGLAGVMSGPLAGVQPAMGTEILTPTFVVVVIGGLGSFWGVVVAGLLVGVVRGITVLFYPPAAEASMYILMILVLLFRPRGLMGERFEKFE